MRAAMVFIHRWLSLILGVFILLASVSAAIIVIEEPIDHALNPGLFRVPVPAAGAAMLGIDSLIHAAETRGEIVGLTLPERPGLPAVAPIAHIGGEIYVNPYTGQVIGVRSREEISSTFVQRNHGFHVALFGGKSGNTVVLVATAGAVLLVLGGIYLWWKDKIVTLRLRGSWKRINLGLHHLLGVSAFVVLVPMTVTGLTLHFQIVNRAFARLDRGVPERVSRPQSAPGPGAVTISYDSAVRSARTALPDGDLRMVFVPPSTQRPITVGFRLPENRGHAAPDRVAIDRWTGAVLSVRTTRGAGIGARLTSLQRPLHTGEVLGGATEAIWFVCSLILAFQGITGFIMWWNGRPARKAAAARRKAATA